MRLGWRSAGVVGVIVHCCAVVELGDLFRGGRTGGIGLAGEVEGGRDGHRRLFGQMMQRALCGCCGRHI